MTLDQCRNTEEVENYRVELIKQLQTARHDRNIIRDNKLEVQRKIITLQAEKKDLEIAESKANNVIGNLTLEIELAKTKYWRLKE